MDEAFTDLSALMDKARDLMAFAQRVRASLQRDESLDELEVCTASQRKIAPAADLREDLPIQPWHHEPCHSPVCRHPFSPATIAAGARLLR